MKKTLLLAGVASVFAFNAQALDFAPYVGADYNMSFINKASKLEGMIPSKYHSGSINVGTKISPYAAVEVFGELSKHEDKTIYRTKYGAYGVDLFGILPLGCYNEWELLGTAGLGRYVIKSKIKAGEDQGHGSDHEWGWRFGAGVQYNITENWAVRAMYRHVAFKDMKDHGEKTGIRGFDVLSLGVRYAF